VLRSFVSCYFKQGFGAVLIVSLKMYCLNFVVAVTLKAVYWNFVSRYFENIVLEVLIVTLKTTCIRALLVVTLKT
jgi:hypothetical protein